MLDSAVNDLAIEELIKVKFGLELELKQVIVRDIPVNRVAIASVFLTSKHQLYLFIQAQSAMALGDVRKLVKKMGLEAEGYLPPAKDKNYFNRVARDKFRAVFPGRHSVDDSELRYYRLLAPYNPALVRISAVTDGVIRQFDPQDSSGWRVTTKYTYRKITTG